MTITITKNQLFDEIQINSALHVATLELGGKVYGKRFAVGFDEGDIFASLFYDSVNGVPTEFFPYDSSTDSFIASASNLIRGRNNNNTKKGKAKK